MNRVISMSVLLLRALVAAGAVEAGAVYSAAQGVPPGAIPAITSVSPETPTVSTLNQTITISGSNFLGPTLIITPPSPPRTTTLVFAPFQLDAVSSTMIQVSLPVSLLGSWTFQVRNTSGAESNRVTIDTQFRTAGSDWIPEGLRVRESDAAENAIANSSVIQLRDGRWRLYFGAAAAGSVRSAISNDGLTFAVETGARLSRAGSPRVIRLDDGRIRMYYIAVGTSGADSGIASAVSTDDGATFTVEAGERIGAAAAGLTSIITPTIVRVAANRWRMYFSGRPVGDSLTAMRDIRSATSDDLLNWTMDPGVRLGPGTAVPSDALHPSAILNADQSVTLYYGRLTPSPGLWSSTSEDGLTFTTETALEALGKGNDPDVTRLADGTLRMYYNWGDDNSGAIYSAISTPASRLPTTAPAVMSRARLDEVTLRRISDAALDRVSPIALPAAHSLRERLARAEENYRLGSHPAIDATAVVDAINRLATQLGFGAASITRSDLLAYRGAPVSAMMSPLEAVTMGMAIATRTLNAPTPPAAWIPLRAAIEWQLINERSDASAEAHRLLDRLGIRR